MAAKKTIIPEIMDNIDVEVMSPPLLRENPLMKSLIITPSSEIDEKVEMITEIESTASIMKQQLSIRKERVALEVDNKKLDAALKTINTIDKIINAVSSEEVLTRVTKNIENAMDMKMMAEAAERLSNTLKNLMNSNSLDEFGTKKKQKINFMFKSTGTVQGAIQIDNSDD